MAEPFILEVQLLFLHSSHQGKHPHRFNVLMYLKYLVHRNEITYHVQLFIQVDGGRVVKNKRHMVGLPSLVKFGGLCAILVVPLQEGCVALRRIQR